MTTFNVKVADNGYIVETQGEARSLMVYEGTKVPGSMLIELLGEMIDDLHRGADELIVSVSVKPVKGGGEE